MAALPIPGQTIHLYLGGAVGHSCVVVEGLSGVVRKETAKALQIEAMNDYGQDTGRLCWLPKKAIKIDKKDGGLSLAHWFKPEGYTRWFLSHMSIMSGVSA